jgi:hypothetical protein
MSESNTLELVGIVRLALASFVGLASALGAIGCGKTDESGRPYDNDPWP